MLIFERDGGRCQECGRALTLTPGRADSYHCGHRVARERGGSDSIENLQAECAECNLAKGSSG